MEKQTILKITGLGLSFTILLLGCVSTVLLFGAGQSGVNYLFPSKQLHKENAQQRNPSSSWQGVFMQHGWFAGFIYMLPGAAGLISSTYHYKYLKITHLILSTVLIIVGSFIHTILGITMLLYRLFVMGGAVRHNASLVECIYISDLSADVSCLAGRKALKATIVAAALMFLCWIFILFDFLFRALTFSNNQVSSFRPRLQGCLLRLWKCCCYGYTVWHGRLKRCMSVAFKQA